MANIEIAQAIVDGYQGRQETVLAHPPFESVDPLLAGIIKNRVSGGHQLQVSSQFSDCTEISFWAQNPPLGHDQLRDRVIHILEDEGHQVSFIDKLLHVDVANDDADKMYAMMVAAREAAKAA